MSRKSYYLPQGVQLDHFAQVPLSPSGHRVLGFFGAIAEWLDFDLIVQVARAAPDWQLQFIGKVEHQPDQLGCLPNVRFLPPVSFSELPGAMSDWAAAWIPFRLNELTRGVNPLKAREYLAAGLACHCTPLPEVAALGEHVMITDRADLVVSWLEETIATDNCEKRIARHRPWLVTVG